jgi:hypothetical protein
MWWVAAHYKFCGFDSFGRATTFGGVGKKIMS